MDHQNSLPNEMPESQPGGPTDITLRDLLTALLFPEVIRVSDDHTKLPSDHSASGEVQATTRDVEDFLSTLADPTVTVYEQNQLVSVSIPRRRSFIVVVGVLLAVMSAVAAQFNSFHTDQGFIGALLYIFAVVLWGLLLTLEFAPPDGGLLMRGPRIIGPGARRAADGRVETLPRQLISGLMVITAMALSIAAYSLTGNNTFSIAGLAAWLLSIVGWMLVVAEQQPTELIQAIKDKLIVIQLPTIRLRVVPIIIMFMIVGVGAFFRLYQLNNLPGEMTSDHVEKLLDAYDVSQGQFHVFFPRNGGREAIQMYLVALAARVFGTGMSHLTLKLVSALEAIALIPVIVWLGHELVDWETGLFAAALLAISWWDVTLARLGLRIVLTPLVFTFVLICLIRGLRTGNRRAWIWAGVWMGVGVYSYQAMRIVPLVAIGAWIISISGAVKRIFTRERTNGSSINLEQISDQNIVFRQTSNLFACALISFVLFVPLLRYWHDDPSGLWNRVVNRTTSSEVAIIDSPISILLSNYTKALGMFNVSGDAAWIVSPPGVSALDEITGSLLVLGLVAWIARLKLRRDPADMFLITAGLIMLLPSALAIAFPIENPSLTRASGVLPVVMVLCAWPLALIRQRWSSVLGFVRGGLGALILIMVLLVASGYRSYIIYFHDFKDSYDLSALNPGEVAHSVRQVIGQQASLAGVWLVGWPFWHDYRAIGIDAGDITFANAILDFATLQNYLANFPQNFESRPLVFIINSEDKKTLEFLSKHFPAGKDDYFPGRSEKHSYHLFVVR